MPPSSNALAKSAVLGKALDDRVGCAILMQLLANDYECDFYGVFTVQEEVGFRGMYAAAYSVAPDVVIVLEAPPQTICRRSKTLASLQR